ncbi:MAG TPA: efflux RND transporter periplasmic adaptor subunit [Anaeromyxobacter sp.]|nr:efflux RND transporter periplasmic adaptor subunit [Anaeromyxobacter sp.]
MDRTRALKIGAPIAAALLIGGLGARALLREEVAAPAYETAPATRGRVASVVTASGTLSPLVTVQVGSQVSGRIQWLGADFNSRVRKGQVIARIDPSLFESALAQARANEGAAAASVQGAEATVADARRQSERNQALAARKLVAQADADTALAKLQAAEADLAAAKARVAQMRAARAQAETNLAYTTIASPIDGVVISRDVDVGQTVAASLQAPTIFQLAEDLRKMEVHTSVAESDVGRVTEGMPVHFTVDAYPGERFGGTVKEVRYSPKTVQNVVTYDAVVSVDNSGLKLRPGMTADVSFVVEELTDALLVPNPALRFRPPGAATSAPGDGAGAARHDDGARAGAAQGPRAGPRGGAGGGPPSAEASTAGPPAGGAAAAAGGQDAPRRPRRAVWVVAPDASLRQVQVQVGPSDGRHTAVVGGELAEGDRVVTGIAGGDAQGQGSRPQQRPGPPGRFL